MRRAGTAVLATRGSLGSRATLAHTYTYTYDSRDNILTNSESGGVVQMNYDAASRLTTSTAGGVTTTYTFDSNGNLTGVNEAGTLTTMVYDKENRLKEHKQGAAANTRTFTYDLNSLKQSETAGKATNQLVWDGADMLGEVPAVKPVGAPTMPIRYDSGQGIMFATTRFEPDPVRTDTGADFIGSILIDFDENGDFVAERRYKPYGELLAGTATPYGWTGNTGSRATLLQYAEQYNRRRHYSTKLKQWTTRDPLWPSESAYGYVNEGPLTWADPSGQVPVNPWDPIPEPIFTPWTTCEERNQKIYEYCRACEHRTSSYCRTKCNSMRNKYHRFCVRLPFPPYGRVRDRYIPDKESISGRRPCLGCLECAVELIIRWGIRNRTHDCHHKFTHCMTCCVLSQNYSATCALGRQHSQNFWHDIRKGGLLEFETIDNRLESCTNGVYRIPGLSCDQNCRRFYGTPNNKSRCKDQKYPAVLDIPEGCLPSKR